MIKYLSRNKINYKRIFHHILFWIVVQFVNVFLYAYESGEYSDVFWALICTLPLDILAVYITLYFFIPYFLLHKRYFEFFIYFLLSVVAIVLLEKTINFYFVYPVIHDININELSFWGVNILFLAINIYKIVALAAAIKLIKIWYQNLQLKNQLQNQNLQSELALLKNQINPHFLFNTLNNIHTLITKNRVKASDAIIRLSEIMRYMLYDTNTDKVLLEKEIEYLKSYISLQQIRLQENDYVKFEIEGDLKEKTVPPMLFIFFIENAFKHGSKKGRSPGIEFKLKADNTGILFESKNKTTDHNEMNKDKTNGIGLANVKRRLELLYPNKHELTIQKDKNIFHAQLKLYDKKK